MSRRQGSEPELKELRARIDRWRQNRQTREMPAELWAAATEAARRLGVSHVSTALRVGYASLRARVGDASSAPLSRRAAFVEVSGAGLLAPTNSSEVTISVARGDARLTITVRDAREVDLTALVSAFSRG